MVSSDFQFESDMKITHISDFINYKATKIALIIIPHKNTVYPNLCIELDPDPLQFKINYKGSWSLKFEFLL